MDDTLVFVRAVISTTAARWMTLAETLPAELVARKPAAGEWSAVECLQHLHDTEQAVFPLRVEAFLAGRDFTAFDPDTQGVRPGAAQSALALAQEFARLRAASLSLLATLKPEDLARRARHPALGMVTMGELLNEWAAHDLMHTVQAERALMQPFIAECGPWQPSFADHVARGKQT